MYCLSALNSPFNMCCLIKDKFLQVCLLQSEHDVGWGTLKEEVALLWFLALGGVGGSISWVSFHRYEPMTTAIVLLNMQSWCGLVISFLWPSSQGYPMLQATYSLFPGACLLSHPTSTNTSLISCSAPSATALPTVRPSWFCVHDINSRPPAPPGPLFLLHVHTLATSYGMSTLICSRGLLPASLQL